MKVSNELSVGSKVLIDGKHNGETQSLPWFDEGKKVWVVMVSGAPGEIWPLEKVQLLDAAND